jgi:hypothetical protein
MFLSRISLDSTTLALKKTFSNGCYHRLTLDSVEEFVVRFTNGSMLASYFSDKEKVDDISRDKLLRGASRELSQFVDKHSGRLSFPLRTRLVSANKN